jgi:hypothetical protein
LWFGGRTVEACAARVFDGDGGAVQLRFVLFHGDTPATWRKTFFQKLPQNQEFF